MQEVIESECCTTEVCDYDIDIQIDRIEVSGPKYFDTANLVLKCSCGKQEVLSTGVKDGIQIFLQTTDEDTFVLACPCGNTLSLYFEESKINEPEDIQQ